MIRRELFETFARSYDPPHWIIEELMEHAPPTVRSALTDAIHGVSPQAVAELDEHAKTQAEILFAVRDPDLRARLYLVSREAAQMIARTRLDLVTQAGATAPYSCPALRGIEVDDEGLVALSAFTLEGDALCLNGYAFFVLPPVAGSNANYWLLQSVQRHDLVDAVRVRLDPLLFGPADELSGRFYRAAVYGRPLDWNIIRQLRAADHGRWMPGRLSRGHLFTDYAWVPHEREVDFLCEELPLAEDLDMRGSRYLHAIYDKSRDRITHLDGAIRIMRSDEFTARAQTHVRNAGKVGVRVKTFRTDRPIEAGALGELAQAFFFWNYDVARYFGAPIHPDL